MKVLVQLHRELEAFSQSLTFGPPFLALVFEVSDPLFLFRVHGDDRMPPALKMPHLLIEILELCIPVRMAIPLSRLTVGLQAVAQVIQ